MSIVGCHLMRCSNVQIISAEKVYHEQVSVAKITMSVFEGCPGDKTAIQAQLIDEDKNLIPSTSAGKMFRAVDDDKGEGGAEKHNAPEEKNRKPARKPGVKLDISRAIAKKSKNMPFTVSKPDVQVEDVSDVPIQQIQKQIIEGISDELVEQMVDVPGPLVVEGSLGVTSVIPQERTLERVAGQIIDVPVPHSADEIVDIVKLILQEPRQQRTY